MVATERTLAAINIADPIRYQEEGYPWADWDLLRRVAPVYYHDRPGTRPFWAVTRYEDILAISKNPKVFLNTRYFTLQTIEGEAISHSLESHYATNDLLEMDPPEHGLHRNTVNRPFTPRALRAVEERIQEMSQGIIEDVVTRLVDPLAGGGRADFVTDFSVKLPVYVICDMMGVPREDADQVLLWTNEGIAPDDPEFKHGRTAEATAYHSFTSMLDYFRDLVADRRKHPRDDLTTMVAEARVDGAPLPEETVLGILNLLLIAGNETTRNATSGGMLSLLDHPDQFDRLRAAPALLDSAIEEMLRWTSPLIHFVRHVAEDTVVGSQPMPKGDRLVMYYPSANRDESIFPDPYVFDITRSPNDHLAFGGFGEHYCLGANLARLELRVAFRHLLSRLPNIERDGPIMRTRAMLIGGMSHMPVRVGV